MSQSNPTQMETASLPHQLPPQWFALRVKSRHEKAVAAAARSKGFEEFLPLYRWKQTWSDRLKWVEMPLFPGYVFCRLDPDHRLPVLTIPGVLNMVSVGRTPIPIADSEIASVQAAVRANLMTEPCSFVEAGRRIRMEQGPLAGTEGFLAEDETPRRVVLSLTILKRSIAVEIERQWTEPLALPAMAGDRGD